MAPSRWQLALGLLLAALCSVEGSYRFGSTSWKAVRDAPPNTVDFELVTGWRRDFKWVYVSQQHPAMGPTRNLESPPIVGDVLRVTGLTFADATGMQAATEGTSEIMFETGDGKKYFIDVTVTAFSASQNWVMGTTHIRHTYARPFQAEKQKEYFAGYSYEAGSAGQLEANQPFSHTPWTASFAGCCRWESSLEGNANKMYKIVTSVDLTDRDNAPALRSLPIVTVPQAENPSADAQPTFFVMAKDQFVPGTAAPVAMSGGNTNYELDDARAATLMYSVASSADLGLAGGVYTPFPKFSVVSSTSGKVRVETNSSTGPLAAGYYQVAVLVRSGTSRTLVDFMLHVVPRTGLPVPAAMDGSMLTGDDKVYEALFGWVGYSMSASLAVSNPAGSSGDLVLNYVFAGLSQEATSVQSGGVEYSATELNHQGLPAGASLHTVADNAIVDMLVTFDNPAAAHRPGHDAAMNKQQRDFTFAVGAEEAWGMGYRPVLKQGASLSAINPAAIPDTVSLAAFDMNVGTGGAATFLWVKRSSEMAAVTEVRIAHCAAEKDRLTAEGFTMLPQNLNEQSSSPTAVYLFYKRGSGPALTDIALVDVAVDGPCAGGDSTTFTVCDVETTAKAMCGTKRLVPGNLNFPLAQRTLLMYVQVAPQGSMKRMLAWVPRSAGHFVFCYSGSVVASPTRASTQRCIDMDIKNDPAPVFQPLAPLSTKMGKVLRFNVSYVDINHMDEKVSTMMDMEGLQLAGATLGPVKSVGVPGDARHVIVSREVDWFPDPTYGGFSGDVCFKATDVAGMYRTAQETRGCVKISVERCVWHVQTEDTLIQVAARFATNWLQIWHLNPQILHPDTALPPNMEINIGHLYEVEPNDAMAVLAERFGTSIKHINLNNFDLAHSPPPGNQIQVGAHICVIPNSCVTAKHNVPAA